MTLQYVQTKRTWSPEEGFHQENCEPRIVEHLVGRAFVRKLGHKKHGQTQEFHIRQTVQRMQTDNEFLKSAAREMHVAVPDIANIPSFGERYYTWLQKRKANRKRKQQKLSRKINRN